MELRLVKWSPREHWAPSPAGLNINLNTTINKSKKKTMCYSEEGSAITVQFSSVTYLSDSAIPWTAVHQASLSITNSWCLVKLLTITSMMPSNHLILCCPLLLLSSICPSINVFSNELVLHIRYPKYQSFNFNISPSNEYSGLISFRIDWFDLLAVQGSLKSLL